MIFRSEGVVVIVALQMLFRYNLDLQGRLLLWPVPQQRDSKLSEQIEEAGLQRASSGFPSEFFRPPTVQDWWSVAWYSCRIEGSATNVDVRVPGRSTVQYRRKLEADLQREGRAEGA